MNSVTRRMTLGDSNVICRHREAMYREAGRPVAAIEAAVEPFRQWLEPRLADGRYIGWAVATERRVIAGAGLIVLDWPPHPLHPIESRRGYILNVYVDPASCGQGLAKHLMQTAQAAAHTMGIGYLVLHASDLGRPVYERLGWVATDEMALRIASE